MAMVTAAAQDLRVFPCCLGPACCRNRFDRRLAYQKARSILQVAEANQHDALVLGAFGCGAFGNDPEVIADIFQQLLNDEFTSFKVVVFAVVFSERLLQSFGRRFQMIKGSSDAQRYEELKTMATATLAS